MRYVLLATLLFTAPTAATAEDLPNNAVLTNRSAEVTIYSVNDAKITHDTTKVTISNGHRIINVNAALEISVNVEGNLCGSKPNDVLINTSKMENGNTLLSLARRYTTDPFTSIISACLAYSAPRDATVAIKLYDYAFDTDYEESFLIPFGNEPNRSDVLVQVRYDNQSGLTATILR